MCSTCSRPFLGLNSAPFPLQKCFIFPQIGIPNLNHLKLSVITHLINGQITWTLKDNLTITGYYRYIKA